MKETLKKLRKQIKGILNQPFGEIATTSGVFSGYQLSHKVSDEFTKQILNLLKEELEGLTVMNSNEKYARTIAQAQLSHNIRELKERLG